MKSLLLILLTGLSFNLTSFGQTVKEQLGLCELDSIDSEKVLFNVDTPPTYKGGMSQFYSDLISNLHLSDDIKTYGAHTKFYFSLVIDPSGKIRNFCEANGHLTLLSSDSLRNIDNWTSGTLDGKEVPVRLVIPVYINVD